MGDPAGETADRLHLLRLVELPQEIGAFQLRPPAIGDVAQYQGEDRFLAELELGGGELSGKFAAVAASGADLLPLGRRGGGTVDAPLDRLDEALAVRKQEVETPPDGFVGGVAEDSLRALVEQTDGAGVVDGDDRILGDV